mgnify:CR=1 FL=1
MAKAAPRYVSAVVCKNKDKLQEEGEMKLEKSYTIHSYYFHTNRDDVFSMNVTDDFFKIGAYCQLDYPPELPNTVVLKLIRRHKMTNH